MKIRSVALCSASKPKGGVSIQDRLEWSHYFQLLFSPLLLAVIGRYGLDRSSSLSRQLGTLSPHDVTLPTRTESVSFKEA